MGSVELLWRRVGSHVGGYRVAIGVLMNDRREEKTERCPTQNRLSDSFLSFPDLKYARQLLRWPCDSEVQHL